MSAPPIGEIYADPQLQRGLQRNCLVPLDELLASMDGWDETEDRPGYLDALQGHRDPHRAKSHAAFLLSELRPEFILRHYGEEVLAWTAANAHTTRVAERFRNSLGELLGYDEEFFEKSSQFCYQEGRFSTKGADVLAHYAVMQALHGGSLDAIDLPSILQSSAHPGVTLSDKRLTNYAIEPIRSEKSSWAAGSEVKWGGTVDGLNYGMWLDVPSGFALLYKGVPQAITGLASTLGRKDEIMIHQLQGIRPGVVGRGEDGKETIISHRSSRGIAPLDWQKLLTGITEHVAASIGMGSVGILEGKRNYWVKPRRGETPTLTEKAAKRIYDKTAKRLGFKKGADGNWHRPITGHLQSSMASS